jgi:N-acetylglucosamine kinase-like BadF-type ATPase
MSEPHRPVLLIDGGKSKTAVAIIDATGGTIAEATGPGLAIIAEPGGPAALRASLAETLSMAGAPPVAETRGLAGGTGAFATAVFGLNGVHAPSPDADVAAGILCDLVRADRVVVTSDGVLGYVGALGVRPGVAVTVGTGSVIFAIGRAGDAHRVDGNGPLLGDRGSGYSIGLAGLRAGMRVLEGLAGSDALADEVRRRYGSPDDAVHEVHASSTPTRLIASFSRSVAGAAVNGDASALEIWRRAGAELAEGAAAAATRAGLAGRPYPVAWSGGLFAAGDLLVRPFADGLARIAPEARVQEAPGGALSGGAVLAAAPAPVMRGVSSWYGPGGEPLG